ncbi:recombinase family protein [Micromonospora sp. STR1s_5]|nr:recombinase family protein [Micromonospora sp. STR1s_5]
MLVGLARTSTTEQEAGLEAQKRALAKAGVEKVFVEQTSAVGARPGLEGAIEWCRDGDVLACTDLSRIARSVADFCRVQSRLASKGVELRVLNIGMDTATPTGKLMLNVLASVAQFEREMMLERQREGIAKARRDGKYKGRAPTARAKAEEVRALDAQRMKKTEIAKELGISVRSVHRLLAESSRVEAARVSSRSLSTQFSVTRR